MHSYQPVNHTSSEAHRYRQHNPSLERAPVSPHFRPSNPVHSNYPTNSAISIKPHNKFTSTFVLNKEDAQKLSQNVYPHKDLGNWNKETYFANNCNNIQQPPYQGNQEQMKFNLSNIQQDCRRGSAGLGNQQLGDSKVGQRRSESIVGIRQKLTHQQGQKDNNFCSYRPNYDYAIAQDGRKTQRSTSPFVFNFNAHQIAVSSNNNRQREQRQKMPSLSKKDESYKTTNNISSAPRQSNFRSAFQELRPRVSNYNPISENTLKNEGDKYSASNSNTFKQSSVTAPSYQRKDSSNYERKNSTKDLNSNKSTYDKPMSTIERDIEMLKHAAKHTNQVFERQLSKNSYLSKLIQERSNKASSNAPSKQYSENNQSESKIYQLQRDLDEKSKEICDKNKEIWDKSKIIIDKNKIIDNLSNELRQCRRKIEQNENGGHRRHKQYDDKLNQHIQENKDLKERLSKVQESVQDALSNWKQQKIEKERDIQEKNKKIQDLNQQLEEKDQIISTNQNNIHTLNKEILSLKQQINELKQNNSKLTEQIKSLRQAEAKKQIQIFDLKSEIISKEKEIMTLKEKEQSLNQKIKSFETQTSKDDLKMTQQLPESCEIKDSVVEEEVRKKIAEVQQQQQQLFNLLFKEGQYDHMKVIPKLKQLIDHSKMADSLKVKEQQRVEEHQILKLHQDYYEKKCYQINRELKKAGNKLLGVSHQVHQGNKLLSESNQQIVLFNLNKLNEKYKMMVQSEEA